MMKAFSILRIRLLVVLWVGAAVTPAVPAAEPTEYEQYMLELINRARANPAAEVTRLVGESNSQPGYWGGFYEFNSYEAFVGTASLNEGPPILGGAAYAIPSTAKQPLAFNVNMMDATRAYVRIMQANNSVGHTLGGTTVEQRLTNQGYTTEFANQSGQNNYYPGSENNSTIATSEPFDGSAYPGDIRKEAITAMHHNLFTDGSASTRGHRMTMMASDWREAGVGLDFGTDGEFRSVYANHTFGIRSNRGPFITGVAYNDKDANGFYTPAAGEALGGLTVTVYTAGTQKAVASTTSFGSGGYGLIVPPGNYDVRFVSAAGGIDQTVFGISVTTLNVKVDAVNPGFNPPPVSVPFRISSITVLGNDVVLTWPSTAGASYRVTMGTALKGWETIDNTVLTGTGSPLTYRHVGGTSGSPARYYRVERL